MPPAVVLLNTETHRNAVLQVGDASDGPQLESQTTGKRYSLRQSTQGCHPGVNAGLARRRREDISAEAGRKKEAQRAKTEAAAREREEKNERALVGVKRLAALQDKRARKEAADLAKLHDPPTTDDEETSSKSALFG